MHTEVQLKSRKGFYIHGREAKKQTQHSAETHSKKHRKEN